MRHFSSKALVGGLACVSLLVPLACTEAETPMDPAEAPSFGHGTLDLSSADQRELAQLRRRTAPYHDFAMAAEDGWDTPITVCWFHSELGAMGYHYGNLPLIDGTVSLLEPELLVYEPRSDGSLRLVAMEYLVPTEAWEGADPPSLLGQEFHDTGAGLYILHVWLWLHNPTGMFMDWNPRATCEHAAESEDRAS